MLDLNTAQLLYESPCWKDYTTFSLVSEVAGL